MWKFSSWEFSHGLDFKPAIQCKPTNIYVVDFWFWFSNEVLIMSRTSNLQMFVLQLWESTNLWQKFHPNANILTNHNTVLEFQLISYFVIGCNSCRFCSLVHMILWKYERALARSLQHKIQAVPLFNVSAACT